MDHPGLPSSAVGLFWDEETRRARFVYGIHRDPIRPPGADMYDTAYFATHLFTLPGYAYLGQMFCSRCTSDDLALLKPLPTSRATMFQGPHSLAIEGVLEDLFPLETYEAASRHLARARPVPLRRLAYIWWRRAVGFLYDHQWISGCIACRLADIQMKHLDWWDQRSDSDAGSEAS
ncbi:hypothetical protein WJX74_010816 [Apatococcus lobatus]|uniref:Uncharacterized protein n=1 Tax=Apatococcus lobatus TaxID=904363 RepID=A0AAW1Q5P8_9CHLO